MKTIQEYLKEADREKLIDYYLKLKPIKYDVNERYLDMTVREIKEAQVKRLNEYIDHLCSIEPVEPENGKHGILYVYCLDRSGNPDFDMCCPMAYLDELKEDIVNANDYLYVFCSQAEIMGFFVGDNPLTQLSIYELMAQVMVDASFLGFKNERYEESKEWGKTGDDEKDFDDNKDQVQHAKNSFDENDPRSVYKKAKHDYFIYIRGEEREKILNRLWQEFLKSVAIVKVDKTK